MAAEDLPQEALIEIFHHLPIKDRSRLACVAQAWREASLVDAVSIKLKHSHVPHYLHVALPDGAAQLQAAGCPMMSLARSADITWSSASAAGNVLQSMPSLERLAFTSMNSVPRAGAAAEADSGLQRLSSLTNLQSLHLNTNDVGQVLEAACAPTTLRTLELHLTGDNWQSSVLDKIATQLGSQACQLRSLVLRCSHASVYAATQAMESLSLLTALTSLRMGPNPEDIFPHSSPLGFLRLPSFVSCLTQLQQIDIALADSAAAGGSLSALDFAPVCRIPDVRITLRADTSIRAVKSLPPSLSSITGLTQLTVQGFTFEDPGGWCTTGYFDVLPLASNPNLRRLDLQLVTYECEHCEGFELSSLDQLTQLHSLSICVASPTPSTGGGSSGGASSGGRSSTSGGGSSSSDDGPELLLMLPRLNPAKQVTICSSMRVVLRNSKVLARAKVPGVLAHSIMLEEPLPRAAAGDSSSSGSSSSSSGAAGRGGSKQRHTPAAAAAEDTAAGAARDQATRGSAAAAAAAAAQQQEQEPRYVRAPAHVVISALRELWPSMEVWQYSVQLPAASSRGSKAFVAELCCRSTARDSMQQQLTDTLRTAIAGMVDEAPPTAPVRSSSGRRFAGLWGG